MPNFLLLNHLDVFLQHHGNNFTYKRKKNAIINPNKDTPLAATSSKRFGGAGIYKPTADRLQPDKRPPAGVSELRSFSPKENKGVMIHDQQHAKVKQEKWYKIEIITIHVQHAGLIFLMQIFVFFFYIIEQAIKLMRFARRTS